MTLQQASNKALEAAQAGDLETLAQALEARQLALDRGELPTPGILSSGALTMHLLRQLIVRTRGEETRLRRLWNFIAAPPPASSIDLRG